MLRIEYYCYFVGFNLFWHYLCITFQSFTILYLAWNHWWGFHAWNPMQSMLLFYHDLSTSLFLIITVELKYQFVSFYDERNASYILEKNKGISLTIYFSMNVYTHYSCIVSFKIFHCHQNTAYRSRSHGLAIHLNSYRSRIH